MLCRSMSGVEHLDRAASRSNDRTIGKANPLVSILSDKFIAHRPILRLILAPFGMNLLSDLGRQAVGKALHGNIG